MTPQASLPLTADEAARQQAILTAEIAAGWITPPPEDWQLPGPDDSDPGPDEPPWLIGDRPATAPAPRWTAPAPPGTAAGTGDPQPAPPSAAGDADGRPSASCGAAGGAGSGEEPTEVLPCGIVAHDTHGPGGPGFASGSVLDCLEPGPVLTAALDDAEAAGLAGLSDDALAGMILAWRRAESHAAAGLLTATAELHRRRATHPDPHVGEHAADELAILLTLTGRAADTLLAQAATLARLPATQAALRTGQIDRSRATIIGYETELLDDETAAKVEQRVIGKAPSQTTSRLRSRVRDAVMTADADAVRRRKTKAAKDARVELQSEMSGNAELAGRELPPAAALAADARIDACARSLKANGIKATLPQLRAAVFLALLTGSDPLAFLPPPGTDPGADTGPAAGTPPDTGTPDRTTTAPNPGPGSTSTGTGDTGTGETGAGPSAPRSATAVPASASGTGSAHPQAADTDGTHPAAPAAPHPHDPASGEAGPDGSVPDGSVPEDSGPDGYPGDPPGPSSPGRPGEPAGPGRSSGPAGPGEPGWPAVPAGLEMNGSVHLTVPLTTWLGLAGTPGETAGYGAADGDTSRAIADFLAASRRSRWCLTITDPGGRAIAHACARRPPPASPDARAAWLKTLKITRIETGTCSHAREVPGYRIPGSLHHIVKTRQRTCSGPGCNRPAARCDTDHTLAYDHGGRTCECGLAPLCRKHHTAKQTQGWHLEQPEPGVLIWRLPSGRSYTITPTEYPV